MPRGKYVNHKGRSRHFTSPEELEQESDENSEETGSGESNDESGAAGGASGSKGTASSKSSASGKQSQQKNRKAANLSSGDEDSDEDGDEDESDDDARGSKKGVASLIEIENPNRAIKRATQKVSHLSVEEKPAKPELTRREREQIEKQKARQRYEKLHAAGKTSEAKADLARLALIRQQREEAAAKREAEKKAAESKKPTGKA